MSMSQKILVFGVSSLVTALLAVLLITTAKEGKSINDASSEQMQEIAIDIKNSGIMKYNGDVYGSDVRNCIKKYLGDYSSSETASIYVYVKTSTSTNTYTNGSYIDNIYDFTDVKFIKPTVMFHGKVIKNENDAIVGIDFVQK